MYTKILLAFTVLTLAGTYATVFAQLNPDFADVESECQTFEGNQTFPNGTKVSQLLDCKWLKEFWIPNQTPPITAVQDNLTDEEIEVIKEAIKCRSDPYCNPPTPTPHVTAPIDSDDPDEILDLAEENRKRACDQLRADPEDLAKQDLCDALTEAKLCEQGINESQPVQKHRFFLTTDFQLSIWRHWDYNKNYVLGVLTSANLECLYQRTILEPIILGQQYKDIQEATINDIQPYHGDMVSRPDYRVEHQQLTASVFANANKVAENAVCNLEQFKTVWKDYGCPPKPLLSVCHMPTDKELLQLHKQMWIPEWEHTPIKEYYQAIHDECVWKMENAVVLEVGWYDRYIDSTKPMVNLKEYKLNPKTTQPIGIPKTFIIVEPQQGNWTLWK